MRERGPIRAITRSANSLTQIWCGFSSALVSLALKVAVDDPRRFSRSRNVGALFGLTPREHSSGEMSYQGRISTLSST